MVASDIEVLALLPPVTVLAVLGGTIVEAAVAIEGVAVNVPSCNSSINSSRPLTGTDSSVGIWERCLLLEESPAKSFNRSSDIREHGVISYTQLIHFLCVKID